MCKECTEFVALIIMRSVFLNILINLYQNTQQREFIY